MFLQTTNTVPIKSIHPLDEFPFYCFYKMNQGQYTIKYTKQKIYFNVDVKTDFYQV